MKQQPHGKNSFSQEEFFLTRGKNLWWQRTWDWVVNWVSMAEWESKTRTKQLLALSSEIRAQVIWQQSLKAMRKVEAGKTLFIPEPAVDIIILYFIFITLNQVFTSHKWLNVWGRRKCKLYEFQWRITVNILFCFNKYLSSICYVSSSMLGVRDTKMSKPWSLPQEIQNIFRKIDKHFNTSKCYNRGVHWRFGNKIWNS